MVSRPLMSMAAALLLPGLLAGCASTQGAVMAAGADAAVAHPEARSFTVSGDAMADVDTALAQAAERGTRVLLVMGANWCHDSRALAGWLETDRFAALVARRYELVFVNVGMPQTGDGHNLDVARRFGIEALPGTPSLLVLTASGELVNGDTATTWRNAASRSEEAIFAELSALAGETS